MNKKVLTIIITVISFIALSAVSVGFMIKEGIISANNLFLNKRSNIGTSEKSTSNANNLDYPLFEAYIKEGANVTLQYADENCEIDEYCDIYFKMNEITISKLKGDFDICDDWEETKDINGNITNNYSYVICNVTVENKGKYKYFTSLNNMFLGINKDHSAELRAYNSNKEITNRKHYCYINYEPNKEYNFNLAYIVEDSCLEKNIENLFLDVLSMGYTAMDNKDIPIFEKE